jgi:hypothetical protein
MLSTHGGVSDEKSSRSSVKFVVLYSETSVTGTRQLAAWSAARLPVPCGPMRSAAAPASGGKHKYASMSYLSRVRLATLAKIGGSYRSVPTQFVSHASPMATLVVTAT